MENRPAVEPIVIPLHLLKEMTNDFSEERLLRRDMFGKVYKGVYKDGQAIAVRLLNRSIKRGGKNFQHEITNHIKIHHQNIVQLVGYCSETKSFITAQKNGRYVISDKTNRVMCFEYLPNGSLDQYISGPSSGLDWNTRYRIIKSICEGLRYLHEELPGPIIHMNLKPSNILLDENMVSKLDNPAVRLFYDENNMVMTGSITGTMEYIPPEFIQTQVISKQYDIYSLGVVIKEIVTGKKYRLSAESIEQVHKNWKKRLEETVKDTLVERYCQQVKKCLEIALECVQPDRLRRPSIMNITTYMLNTADILVHPLELVFSMRSASCLLQLNNRGDDRIAFMLVANSSNRYFSKKPLCGVMPPRCAYTLILTMLELPRALKWGRASDNFFTLYTVPVGEYDLLDVDKDSVEYDNFFQKARQTADYRDEVKEVMLKAICEDQRPFPDFIPHSRSSSDFIPSAWSFPEKPFRSTVEIITTKDAQQVSSIDVHRQWIITTNHMGSICIWNYKKMMVMEPTFHIQNGLAAKFLEGQKLMLPKFVTGDRSRGIHVYTYNGNETTKRLDAHDSCITNLAVHPTRPLVLSSSDDEDHHIKLWRLGKDFESIRTFQGHTDKVTQITFNPKDNDSFASASWDGTVKIWRICSDDPNDTITLKLKEHAEGLLCVDYFTRRNRQHLIVGCKDKTAQVWDLGTQECVDMLEGHADHVTAVNLHPNLPVLVTGSLDGTVRIWNSTTYKLENIIDLNLGAVYALGCIRSSKRILVGCHQGMATVKISLPWSAAE